MIVNKPDRESRAKAAPGKTKGPAEAIDLSLRRLLRRRETEGEREGVRGRRGGRKGRREGEGGEGRKGMEEREGREREDEREEG